MFLKRWKISIWTQRCEDWLQQKPWNYHQNYQWRTTKLWLPWTQDETLDSIWRKDILIFVCRSTCCWAFARITNVVVNARHKLILIRSRNDYNCLVGNPVTKPEIELFKVQWLMPHVALNEINKLSMLRALESSRYLRMSFRSWDLYEYSLLQNTTKHWHSSHWTIKTAIQLEKQRYVIFALQTGRKNVMSRDVSVFDDCNLSNVKVYLNSEFYPFDDLNLGFGKKKYAILFDMYARCRKLIMKSTSKRCSMCSMCLSRERALRSLIAHDKIRQEHYCGRIHRIWLQGECACHDGLLPHHTQSCNRVLFVVQRST